ncbi:mortality factor 4-like protein 1 [Sarcophilus harrisii]|uniref:mortality factor 4-like protein 1 n=1 Tax=Sarcophilus harrisii TaxID=9305 RepID=UPI00062BA289|nr:mortality factor 4-like protein 1 [Sarcophilus harrisii]
MVQVKVDEIVKLNSKPDGKGRGSTETKPRALMLQRTLGKLQPETMVQQEKLQYVDSTDAGEITSTKESQLHLQVQCKCKKSLIVDPKEKQTCDIRLQVRAKYCPMTTGQNLLEQDWSLVTFTKKLFKVPAKKTVDNILTTFAIFQPNFWFTDEKYVIDGLVAVIKEYFDLLLTTQLLYDFERSQYADILTHFPILQMSQISGSAHLLHLFPKLGSVLACSPLNNSSIHMFMNHLQDFLEYLARNPSQLLTEASD